jgi:hypothetical protein
MNKVMLVVGLLFGALLLSGCFNMKVITTVNEDGSGTWEFGFNFDESMLELLGEDAGSQDFDLSAGLLGEGAGEVITDPETGITFTTEERDLDGAAWVFIKADIPDVEGWADLEPAFTNLETMTQPGGTTDELLGETAVDPTESLSIFPRVMVGDGMVRVKFVSVPPADAMASDDPSAEELQFFDMNELFSLVYEVSLPGEITNHNGEIDPETGAVIWEVDFYSTEPIQYLAEARLE